MRPNPIAALRREAGVSVAECAALYRVSPSTYRRWEAGGPDARDRIALLAPLARLLSARLGRPISPQWELCGLVAPSSPSRHEASRAALPSSKRGQAGPCATSARLATSHPARLTVVAGIE